MASIQLFSRPCAGRSPRPAEQWIVPNQPDISAEVVRLLERQARRQPTLADRKLLWEAGHHLLADESLTALRQRLSESPDGLSLVASPDDPFPLEFATVGDEFLGLTHVVSRAAPPESSGEEPRPSRKLRGVILSDSRFDLLEAHYEAADLRRLWSRSGHFADVQVLGSYVTIRDAAAALADCDWLHVCGHAEGSSGGGWIMRNGLLTAEMIFEATRDHSPQFVFANACGSVASITGDGLTVREALLRNGCRHLLGTLVPIPDRRTKPFVESLYHELLAGEPIGKAVLAGRRAVASSDAPGSILWGSYVHYGHPCERLVPSPAASEGVAAQKTREPTRVGEFPVKCSVCGRQIHTTHGLADPAMVPAGAQPLCRVCARSSVPEAAATSVAIDSAVSAPIRVLVTQAPAPDPVTSKPSCLVAPWRARLHYALHRFHQGVATSRAPRSAERPQHREDTFFSARVLPETGTAAPASPLDLYFIDLSDSIEPINADLACERLAPFASAGNAVVCLVSTTGWTETARSLVTGSPNQAYFSAHCSLVLFDAALGQFYGRAGDVRVDSVKSAFDLETDDEKRARVREGVLALCPLEISVAATTLEEKFRVPLAIVIDAMRDAAKLARLHLDEIPGHGWVLS